MKRILTAAAVIILLMGTVPASAAQTTVTIDGKQLNAPVIIESGRVLVPMRQIFTTLGANITWNAADKSVLAEKDGKNIILNFAKNSNTAYIDSIPYKLDAPPKIVNGNSFVPLRFVSVALNADVQYQSYDRIVTITSAKPTTNVPISPVPQPEPIPVDNMTDRVLQPAYAAGNSSLATLATDKMPYVRIYNNGDWDPQQEVFTLTLPDTARWNTPGENEIILQKDRSTTTLNIAKANDATGYIKRADTNTLNVYIRKATAWSIGDYIEIPINVNFNNAISNVSLKVTSDNPKNNGNYEFATISKIVTGITISRKDITIELNSTRKLSATVYPRGVYNSNFRWESADIRIASVDQNGVITGVSKGKTLITVYSAEGGYTDRCNVNVVDPYYSVIYDYATMPNRVAWLKIKTPDGNNSNAGRTFTLKIEGTGEWNMANQRDLPLDIKANPDAPTLAGTQNAGAVATINALDTNILEITLKKAGDWKADELWIPLNVRLNNPGNTMKITISSNDSFFNNESFDVPVY